MSRDEGASAVEYGLMLAAITAAIVAILFSFGSAVRSTFEHGSSCFVAEISARC